MVTDMFSVNILCVAGYIIVHSGYNMDRPFQVVGAAQVVGGLLFFCILGFKRTPEYSCGTCCKGKGPEYSEIEGHNHPDNGQ